MNYGVPSEDIIDILDFLDIRIVIVDSGTLLIFSNSTLVMTCYTLGFFISMLFGALMPWRVSYLTSCLQQMKLLHIHPISPLRQQSWFTAVPLWSPSLDSLLLWSPLHGWYDDEDFDEEFHLLQISDKIWGFFALAQNLMRFLFRQDREGMKELPNLFSFTEDVQRHSYNSAYVYSSNIHIFMFYYIYNILEFHPQVVKQELENIKENLRCKAFVLFCHFYCH